MQITVEFIIWPYNLFPKTIKSFIFHFQELKKERIIQLKNRII